MSYENDRVIQYLPWARHFARACTAKLPQHLDHDDLQSAGVVGYLQAAPRYDSSRGASFRGYCSVRIRGAVLDELRRWNWAPRSVHKIQRRLTSVTISLTEELDRDPTQGELAAALGMKEADLDSYRNQAQTRQMVSLHDSAETTPGEEGLTLTERLPDPMAPQPDAAVLFAENRSTMRSCLRTLPANLVEVIVLHYLHEVPLREVARKLAVTPSRVSQLHHQALGRLKLAWQKVSVYA
jgi:RNA polymerase sigma factor for flagellar operon FliA